MARAFDVQPGGKGSNAAIAAARQGASVCVIARIGDDDFGRMALAVWQREGIQTRHVECAAHERSGVAQILVYDDGDNSIAVAPGAGLALSYRHIDAAADAIESACVVMASNEVPQAATLAAFKMARAAARMTLLNPAPALHLSQELLALTDVLTPNETEVRVVAGVSPDSTLEFAAQALLDRGVGAVVVTLGAHGCVLYQKGQAPQTQAGFQVPVIDTIGAGDTFTGALAAALARGENLAQSMRYANAAAALSVRGQGAIGAMPTLAQSHSFLRDTLSNS